MSSVIHRKKFMGGRISPEEFHAKHAFPIHAKCQGCDRRPVIRAIVMMELAEAKKNPAVDTLMQMAPEAFMKAVVQIKGSDGKAVPYYRVSVTYACKACKRDLQKALAKAPSHCIVEINEGPRPDKMISGYH
jgi:hypothetical protein